jgi:chemotaxis protein MotB
MKRKKAEKAVKNDSSMVIFTNLMILLLAFFIVLVNLASTDQQKKHAALNSLFGSFGFHSGGLSAIGTSDSKDITVPDSPMNKEDVYAETLQDIALANGLDSDVEIRREPDRTVISFGDRIMFAKGSSVIPRESKKFLMEISKFLKEREGLIELRGYAEKMETFFEPDPVNAALYLSTKRAMAVLHFFLEEGRIPASRLVAHGFGISHGGEGNQIGGREWRGKVDIIIGHEKDIPYRLRVGRQRDGFIDFKGFIFKMHGSSNE